MAAPLVRRGPTAALVATALAACVLAGCGGEDGKERPAAKEAPSLPLPEDVALTGSITEPALEPRWLVESTGTTESVDTDNVDARSGTIVLDDVVVSYGRDNISAVDRETGRTAWTSDLDMGGGTICDITDPTTPGIAYLTVTFGDDDFCLDVGRISTEDGHAVSTKRSEAQLVGMATIDDVSHVVDSDGLLTRYDGGKEGDGEPVRRLGKGVLVRSVAPVADPAMLVVQSVLVTDQDRTTFTGLSLPDLEEVWSKKVEQVAPRIKADGDVLLDVVDGRFVFLQAPDEYHLVQMDPATGEQVGDRTYDLDTDLSTGEADALQVDLPNRGNDPNKLVLVGGDAILNNTARGLSRVGPDGTIRWKFRTTGLTLREGEDAFIGNGPLTPDGKQVLATLNNGRSTDLLALDVESGRLVGRWAVAEEYVAGFTANPYVTVVDGGVVLTRNLTLFGDTARTNDAPDPRRPYDVGYFAFPAAKGG